MKKPGRRATLYVPRRPLIDLPPLADEMEGDQELVTVPAAAAPITAEGRRPLIDLPPLADELDEGMDDLSLNAATPIRGSSATTADSVHEVAPAGLPTAASPTEPRSAPPSRTIQRPPTISTPRPTSTPVVPRVAVDEPVTAERKLSTIWLPRRLLMAGLAWRYWRPPDYSPSVSLASSSGG